MRRKLNYIKVKYERPKKDLDLQAVGKYRKLLLQDIKKEKELILLENDFWNNDELEFAGYPETRLLTENLIIFSYSKPILFKGDIITVSGESGQWKVLKIVSGTEIYAENTNTHKKNTIFLSPFSKIYLVDNNLRYRRPLLECKTIF